MIHNDVVNQLQLLVKAVAPPLIEVSDTPLEAPEWVPGQRLPAVVMASLPNGRFQVLVSDHELDMNLPRNTQPGEKLELIFVSSQPRPTFVMAHDLPQQAGMQSEARLSETARFLGALLRGDVPAAGKEQTVAVARMAPLLPGPPADTHELARQLGKALVQSGLFYESHQAQWVAGQRPLADLLHEPQGKLSPRLTGEGKQSESMPVAVHDRGKEIPAGQTNQNQQAERPALREPVHPQTTSLVQQQLDVLDSRNVVWHGQVWPGQNMEWQIEEREARRGDGGETELKEWHTSLRLHLPSLGMVDAKLGLTANGVQLRIDAAQQASAAIMKTRQNDLRHAMESSGLKMLSFEVEVGNGKA